MFLQELLSHSSMAYIKTCVFFSLMMAFLGGSMGTLYQVGDSGTHNVLQVTRQDYEGCSTIVPIATYTGGSDSVSFFSPGDYYFICGYPGMCQQGQKVGIEVSYTTNPNRTPVPPFTNPTPPGGGSQPGTYPYHWEFSAASTAALNFYRHLGLVIFASFVLTFFYL